MSILSFKGFDAEGHTTLLHARVFKCVEMLTQHNVRGN
jgi:hypothetical protein